MSATETATPAGLTCPSCRAPTAPEQEWCMECGTALRRRVVATGSRGRAASLASLAAAAAVGAVVALAVASLLGGFDRSPERAAAPAPPPVTETITTPAASPGAPDPSPAAPGASRAPVWPDGQEAFTVVLVTTPSRSAAESRARALADRGVDAGVLQSDRFEGFPSGRWIVWRGRYQRRAKAEEALRYMRQAGRDGYITFVRQRS